MKGEKGLLTFQVVIRIKRPTGARQLKIQASSVWFWIWIVVKFSAQA